MKSFREVVLWEMIWKLFIFLNEGSLHFCENYVSAKNHKKERHIPWGVFF